MQSKKTYVKTLNRHYLENKIRHATQADLVLMLYEGALNFLNQLRNAILEKNYTVKDDAYYRVQAILQELQNGLNMQEGGEIATSLGSLYAFMLKHLFEANNNSDVQAVESISVMLQELREAWETAMKEQKSVILDGQYGDVYQKLGPQRG